MGNILKGGSRINYRVKTFEGEHTNTKHYVEYTCVCPNCGRHVSMNVTTHVNVLNNMETADMDKFVPTGRNPEVFVVPTEGIAVQCSCGCGMIPVDTVSAKIAFMFMKKYGFENLILPDPINDTGLSFNPSEISFMDPMSSERMKKLVKAIEVLENNQDCKERFQHIVVRVMNDEIGFSCPIRDEREYGPLIKTPETYISVKSLDVADTIRLKNISSNDEFSAYMVAIHYIMSGMDMKCVLDKINNWRSFSALDWDGDPDLRVFKPYF